MGRRRPTLREFLTSATGPQLIAYLTLGDPPDRFAEVASEVISAGALMLELGIPCSTPQEGPVLTASHQRAIAAGFTNHRAFEIMRAIAENCPDRPLLIVLQWSAIVSEGDCRSCLERLATGGAAAILPVGLPFARLAWFADQVQRTGMQLVLSCFADTPPEIWRLALPHCSGCVYIPRRRGQSGTTSIIDLAALCSRLRSETDLPLIVGFDVSTANDVSEICSIPGVAAAVVGSALVDYMVAGGSASEFIRMLLTP
jgi:tryptophan synthase alpha chain